MHGYYLFLGRGDWGTSRAKTLDPTFGGNVPTQILGDWGVHRTGTPLAQAPEWSSAWTPDAWKHHLDFLVDTLKADTLALCMNGFELPYASDMFRLPIVTYAATWWLTLLLAVAFALVAHLIGQRTIHRMNWLDALKAQE